MDANIAKRLGQTRYSPVGWDDLSENALSIRTNLFSPGLTVQAEGTSDPQSSPFAKNRGFTRSYPQTRPYDLARIAIVGSEREPLVDLRDVQHLDAGCLHTMMYMCLEYSLQ